MTPKFPCASNRCSHKVMISGGGLHCTAADTLNARARSGSVRILAFKASRRYWASTRPWANAAALAVSRSTRNCIAHC